MKTAPFKKIRRVALAACLALLLAVSAVAENIELFFGSSAVDGSLFPIIYLMEPVIVLENQ